MSDEIFGLKTILEVDKCLMEKIVLFYDGALQKKTFTKDMIGTDIKK